jgi:hypothetical protein
VAAVPFTVPGWMAEGDPGREEALPQEALPPEAGRADRGRSWRRTAYLLLLSAVVVAAVSGLALGMLR